VATIFHAPASFTGEDMVEISSHGSPWITRAILRSLVKAGAQTAAPGEFSQRAFLNGKIDLTQAEAIADLIASSSDAAHKMAINQLRGTFSESIKQLTNSLIDLTSLLELELDFSEEDVEFADRTKLLQLATDTRSQIDSLTKSYAVGRTFKEGVPVAIVGVPNAGKSTLLNRLLQDDKAIVSQIPGTTRDIIEDTIEINGILFRFIDTAGLRNTDDTIEQLGIQRAINTMQRAAIIIHIIDPSQPLADQQLSLSQYFTDGNTPTVITTYNKIDVAKYDQMSDDAIAISSLTGEGVQELITRLTQLASQGHDPATDIIITNERHFAALKQASTDLSRAIEAINSGLSADFIAQDIRAALHTLGEVTGTISSDTILHTIFSRFCIGK
jgi:tRNA modification GTPase